MVCRFCRDPGQVVVGRDADAGQMLRGADTRELQDVRRADRPGRQDHLAVGLGALDHIAAFEFDADRALVVEQDAAHERLGDDLQVRALHRQMQIGAGGDGAPAAAPRELDGLAGATQFALG
jgi:hypothetical protein